MKETILYIFVFSSILFACDLERELDIQDIDIDRQYFVECYMQPDSLFNLSATEVSPIFEDFILDYSLDFDVFVIDKDTIELLQSLFIEEGTGYVYNFGSGKRLGMDSDQVQLFVITPTEDTLVATTHVPLPVHIIESKWVEDHVSVQFETVDLANENYYLFILNYQVQNEEDQKVEKNELQYLDYSYLEEGKMIEARIESDSLLYASQVEITLMRVTSENFEYQKSLQGAQNASQDNVTFPSPLAGNIEGGIGIFTCFTQDQRMLLRADNP